MNDSVWDYCLALYARPGMEQACLHLQDKHGLDVNLLLLCAWLGQQQRRLDNTTLQALLALSTQWQQQLLGPLRGGRRWLKQQVVEQGQLQTLRESVKAVELAAERQLLELLASATANCPADASATPAANIEYYLQTLDCPRDAALQTALTTVLANCDGSASND